jgi:hypothetical protein
LMSRPCFIQRTASSELALYLGLDASNIIPHFFFFLFLSIFIGFPSSFLFFPHSQSHPAGEDQLRVETVRWREYPNLTWETFPFSRKRLRISITGH